MTEHVQKIANPVGYLAQHLGASGAVGTLEDRIAYSLDRCGLVLITEQRLAQLARTASVDGRRMAETPESGSGRSPTSAVPNEDSGDAQ